MPCSSTAMQSMLEQKFYFTEIRAGRNCVSQGFVREVTGGCKSTLESEFFCRFPMDGRPDALGLVFP